MDNTWFNRLKDINTKCMQMNKNTKNHELNLRKQGRKKGPSQVSYLQLFGQRSIKSFEMCRNEGSVPDMAYILYKSNGKIIRPTGSTGSLGMRVYMKKSRDTESPDSYRSV